MLNNDLNLNNLTEEEYLSLLTQNWESIDFLFKIPKKISTNKIYAWIHFWERQKIVKIFSKEMKKVIEERRKQIGYIFITPIKIEMDFYFNFKPLDISNTSFMFKIIEDSLVKNWLLPNDNPYNVNEIIIRSKKNENNPIDFCYIKIFEWNIKKKTIYNNYPIKIILLLPKKISLNMIYWWLK